MIRCSKAKLATFLPAPQKATRRGPENKLANAVDLFNGIGLKRVKLVSGAGQSGKETRCV